MLKHTIEECEMKDKSDLSIAEIHGLFVGRALTGTPDHLRDECAIALAAEANRQAKAMGLYRGDVTPHILGVLEAIRYQEQVAQAKADLDAAVAAVEVTPALCAPSVSYAVKYLLKALDAFTSTVQAAANHNTSQCHTCCQCKASALGAGSHVQAGC